MNNAIYWKAKEKLRNRINVKLENNEKGYLKCICKLYKLFKTKLFRNNLVAICKSKLALKLGKPAYIGMCILESSKVLIYKYHYG